MKTNIKKWFEVTFVISLTCCILFTGASQAQNIGINEPNPDNSALLEMESTQRGLLIPRMTTVQRNTIASPANALLIYNTTTNCFEFYESGGWYSLGCTCTLPDIAVATAGSGATETQITANWNTTTGATTYYLDASTASDFSSFVSGFDNLNVGNVTTYNVTGLTCATTYYYRVRAGNSFSPSCKT